jgi:hypothetical protein
MEETKLRRDHSHAAFDAADDLAKIAHWRTENGADNVVITGAVSNEDAGKVEQDWRGIERPLLIDKV